MGDIFNSEKKILGGNIIGHNKYSLGSDCPGKLEEQDPLVTILYILTFWPKTSGFWLMIFFYYWTTCILTAWAQMVLPSNKSQHGSPSLGQVPGGKEGTEQGEVLC